MHQTDKNSKEHKEVRECLKILDAKVGERASDTFETVYYHRAVDNDIHNGTGKNAKIKVISETKAVNFPKVSYRDTSDVIKRMQEYEMNRKEKIDMLRAEQLAIERGEIPDPNAWQRNLSSPWRKGMKILKQSEDDLMLEDHVNWDEKSYLTGSKKNLSRSNSKKTLTKTSKSTAKLVEKEEKENNEVRKKKRTNTSKSPALPIKPKTAARTASKSSSRKRILTKTSSNRKEITKFETENERPQVYLKDKPAHHMSRRIPTRVIMTTKTTTQRVDSLGRSASRDNLNRTSSQKKKTMTSSKSQGKFENSPSRGSKDAPMVIDGLDEKPLPGSKKLHGDWGQLSARKQASSGKLQGEWAGQGYVADTPQKLLEKQRQQQGLSKSPSRGGQKSTTKFQVEDLNEHDEFDDDKGMTRSKSKRKVVWRGPAPEGYVYNQERDDLSYKKDFDSKYWMDKVKDKNRAMFDKKLENLIYRDSNNHPQHK